MSNKIFNVGEIIISNFVPEICIMFGYEIPLKIIKIHKNVTVNKIQYIVVDAFILSSGEIKENVLVPLNKTVTKIENTLQFLGKIIQTNNIVKLEESLFKKLLQFALNKYPKENTFTIDDSIDENIERMLIDLSNKTISFISQKDKGAELMYTPLITLESDRNNHKLIYTIPILQYLHIFLPQYKCEIINEEFTTLMLEIKDKQKRDFEKARREEFIIND